MFDHCALYLTRRQGRHLRSHFFNHIQDAQRTVIKYVVSRISEIEMTLCPSDLLHSNTARCDYRPRVVNWWFFKVNINDIARHGSNSNFRFMRTMLDFMILKLMFSLYALEFNAYCVTFQ